MVPAGNKAKRLSSVSHTTKKNSLSSSSSSSSSSSLNQKTNISFVNEHAGDNFHVDRETQNSEQTGKKSVFCTFPRGAYYQSTIVHLIMHI